MQEIIPGIYWLKLPMIVNDQSDLTFVNAYVISGDKGYMLVDAGWNTDEAYAALKNGMTEIGAAVKDITQIVVTHVHPDHYGMAGRIKKETGATLAMHHLEKEFIEPRYVNMEELLNAIDNLLLENGVPQNVIKNLTNATVGLEQYVVPAMPDVLLHDNEIVSTGRFNFRVIWAPGHSSGQICLYEPDKKILLSGDHILPTITPNVSIHPQAIENPLGRYFDSLHDLRELPVEKVLPGHESMFTNLRERIDDILRHHEARNTEILNALGDKPKTSYQVAQKVSWGYKKNYSHLPDFHKRMAVLETLAHLQMMAGTRRVERLPGQDIMLFRKA
ncbi:MAG TPA: MBL fold metallo-hydrolase [Dehalococcoidales bacterium]|nr:MBL fold metallo-hydrolase [Dehalococcoidales bacterium]